MKNCGILIAVAAQRTGKGPLEAALATVLRTIAYARSQRDCPPDSRLRDLVGVDHSAAGEALHHFVLALLGHGEAAF